MFEKHDATFALKGGGLGADLDVLQDIRQSNASPLRLRDGGYFYGDLWKVHWPSMIDALLGVMHRSSASFEF